MNSSQTKRCALGSVVIAARDLDQALAIVPAHGEDGGELDDDLEHLAGVVVVAEQVAEDDEVAGGGHRQEFGQAFDDAEDERDEEEGEVHAAGFGVERGGGLWRPAMAPQGAMRGWMGALPCVGAADACLPAAVLRLEVSASSLSR